jgi:predicted MFS family arabinose efflux permease
MPAEPRPTVTFRASLLLLRTRRFGTFWAASLLSSIGTWAQQVAQPWLLLSLGSSSFVVGLDAFAMDGPVWLLTLVGGILADRADRRRVILFFQSLQMLCPVLIVVLLAGPGVRPWTIVVLSLVVGVTDALSMPSFQSIVPSIVAEREIGTAIALNATQLNLSRILGPAIAGVLMVSVGALGCFVVSALSYVPFILIALWILPPRGRAPRATESVDRRDVFAGLREITRASDLRGALLTVLATSALCSPLITFCPVLVRDVFHAEAGHFGGALAAFGIGGIIGAGILLAIEGSVDRQPLSSRFAIAYGVVVVLAALTPWFSSLVALLVVAGGAMTASNASANTLLQQRAGPRLRGQTASLYMLAIRGGRSLGDLATGVSVTMLGVRRALVIDGVLAVLVHLALARTWARRARGTDAAAQRAV